MSILVLNAGSSSLRFALFTEDLKELYKGHVDAIGKAHCRFRHYLKKGEVDTEVRIHSHQEAIKFVLKKLYEDHIIRSSKEITKVAHRVVHGGNRHTKPTALTPKNLHELEKLSGLAPLHNPVNLLSARAATKAMPSAKHYAIFDTAFFAELPEANTLYGLPYRLAKKEHLRRFGFHGSSHKYVSGEAARLLKNKHCSLITCHMGNGISISAVQNGKALDTTMGFTPLEGPLMGTRSGTVDPGIIFHLLKKQSVKRLEHLLQHESGLKGLSEISSDIRDLRAHPKNEGSKRAFAVLAHQMAKHILSMCAALKKTPDALIFTAGIGENAHYLREQIIKELGALHIKLNKTANQKNKTLISTPTSKVQVLVIPTQEELQMARDLP